MSRSGDAGTFQLLARLPGQILTLIKTEYLNAKREIAAKAKRALGGLLTIVIALFFIFFALCAFVFAAIAGLAVVWPWWLAALVIGAALLLLAVAAVALGFALLKRGVPVPEDTIDRIETDLHAFGDVRVNDSTHAPRDAMRGRREGKF